MKITGISTILVHIPYDTGGATTLAGQTWTEMAILFVKVDTDAGITGWGEGFGHAVAPATKAVLDSMIAQQFIGCDPTDITGLMGEMAQRFHLFGRNGPVTYALSAIDIALWDIAGKRAGLPLSELFGGTCRQELQAYASLLRYGDRELVSRNALRAKQDGYGAIKLHEIGLPQIRAAREAIGPTTLLMCDTNCPWRVSEAIEMAAALRPLNLHWLEEPVWPPEDHHGLARVRQRGVTLAAGENAAGLHDFRHLFELGAIDIAQPSVTKIGGITEFRKITALAEAFGIRLVPHCAYFGPGYLASLQIAASLPQAPLFERLYVTLEASPFGDWVNARDGKVRVPRGPGLGCDPDLSVLERYRTTAAQIR